MRLWHAGTDLLGDRDADEARNGDASFYRELGTIARGQKALAHEIKERMSGISAMRAYPNIVDAIADVQSGGSK